MRITLLLFIVCAALLPAGRVAPAMEAPPPPEIRTEADASPHGYRVGRSGGAPSARIRVSLPSGGGPAEIRPVQEALSTPPASVSEPAQAAAVITPKPDAGAGTPPAAEPPRPEEAKAAEPVVLAVLDGKPITDVDVMDELWARRGRETLDWMIGKAVLEREMAALDLYVLDAEVDERLALHLEGMRKTFPNLSVPDDLTRALSGMRLDEYRERSVWAELALRKIMRAALKPTDEQLRGYYAERQAEFIQPERVRVSQVFVAPQPDPENDGVPGPADWAMAEKLILEAHGRLRLGEDFATVARAYGTGGQLSRWVGRGELLRELEEAAFSIATGSISAPLRSSMGYHILRVEEKRERKLPRFEEVKAEVQERYEDRRFAVIAGEFMTRLREKAIRSGGLVIVDNPELFAGGGK